MEELWTPQKLPQSICQSKNITFWDRALHLTFFDWQIDGGDFFGSMKHFQDFVGDQFKTWWGSIMIFFWNDPKSCIMSYLGGHDFWILSITFLNDYKFIKFYVKFMHCSYPAWQLTVQAYSLQAELHDCFKKTYLFLLLIDLMFMEILLTQFRSE